MEDKNKEKRAAVLNQAEEWGLNLFASSLPIFSGS